jgi:ABC-2 type transport system permease protein
MYWSVVREVWEYRSIYVAPLIAASVFLFGFLLSLVTLPHRMRHALALPSAEQHELLVRPYYFLAGAIMATALVVGVIYCLDTLHGERRDRSILFWKSLPVSDLTTVLSKAAIPLAVLPSFAFVLTVATQYTMLIASSAILAGSGLPVSTLWTELSLFHGSLGLFYHLLTVHVLWHAPIYCWLLLVSAWARRAAFLWALSPLLVIGILEKVVFNTAYFGTFLMHRLAGGMEATPYGEGSAKMYAMAHLTPLRFLGSPGLWLGLIFAAVCLAGAARLRRYREPI